MTVTSNRSFSTAPRRFDSISLRVRDLETSARFYCDVFGLVRRSARPPSARGCWCVVPGDDAALTVQLVTGRPAGSASAIEFFTVEVESPAVVREIHRRTVERNGRATRPTLHDGRWHVFVFDPDGHKVEVVAAADGTDET